MAITLCYVNLIYKVVWEIKTWDTIQIQTRVIIWSWCYIENLVWGKKMKKDRERECMSEINWEGRSYGQFLAEMTIIFILIKISTFVFWHIVCIINCTCISLLQLQNFVDDFKNFNLEIVSICEAICDIPLIYVDTSHVYELKELDCHLSNFRWEIQMENL